MRTHRYNRGSLARFIFSMMVICSMFLGASGVTPAFARELGSLAHGSLAHGSLAHGSLAQGQALAAANPFLGQNAYLKASLPSVNAEFGCSVAISGDTAVVGACQENSYTGKAYVFVRSTEGAWSQQAELIGSNTQRYDQFGISATISGDTIAVGANGEDTTGTNSGAVYVFTRTATTWTQQAFLKGPTNMGASYGASVSMDGTTLAVGAIGESTSETGSGAVYIYTGITDSWTLKNTLKAAYPGSGDQFGSNISLSGEWLLIGAPYEDSAATAIDGDQTDNSAENAGAAYIFSIEGKTNWEQVNYLKASNAQAGDNFGSSVATHNYIFIVGAPYEDSTATGVDGDQTNNSASDAGAAYIFIPDWGTWKQSAYLKSSNTEADDNYGSAVAVYNNTVVVGAPWEASNASGINGDETNNDESGAGAAYLYTNIGTGWQQKAYIKASNPTNFDNVGKSLAMAGDSLIIGSPWEDGNGTGGQTDNSVNGAGASYIFSTTPVLNSFYRYNPSGEGGSATNADSLVFSANFSKDVKNVDADDFTVNSTSTATISSVDQAADASHYLVTVSGGDLADFNGTVSLDLAATQNITDLRGNALPNSEPNQDYSYTLDNLAPAVTSITRASASPSAAASVDFTVTFSKDVTISSGGGGASNSSENSRTIVQSDFSLTATGITGADITAIEGSGSVYTVSVSTGTGSGTLRLDIPAGAQTSDEAGNTLSGLPYTSGEVYEFQRLPAAFSKTSPANGAITRSTPTLSWAASSLADSYEYCLALSPAACSSWTAVSGTSKALSGLAAGKYTWQVRAVNTGGKTYGNGSSGATWSFTVDATAPVVSSIALADPNPSTAASLRYTVTFSENVTGVNMTDFSLTQVGVSGAAVTAVSGSGKSYTVTVSTGSNTGTLRLNLLADGTIKDAPGNPLVTAYNSGPKYTLDRLNTFTSVAAADGWVLETTENSNAGGTLNSTANLMLGDSATKQQYRSILSFDTSGLPDNAQIVRVTLKLRKIAGTGANPFTSFQGLLVDIRQGFFGTALSLQTVDFNAAASLQKAGVVTLVTGSTSDYQSALLNTAFPFVSKTGSTQLRLLFKLDDNNNGVSDTVSFASGNHATAAYRPVLLVEYTLP
jgi:hypothetical protein